MNIMRSLDEDILESKVVRKVLRSLSKRFRPKVTAIEESKDLEVMKLEDLLAHFKLLKQQLRNLPRRRALPLR